MAGATFPDMGYFIPSSGSWWGETTHWGPFYTYYMTYLKKHCKNEGLPPRSSKCKKLWVIFFGGLAHGMGDTNWDANFVSQVALTEFGSNRGSWYTKADDSTTVGADQVAIWRHGQWSLGANFPYWTMNDFFKEYSSSQKKPAVSVWWLWISSVGQDAYYNGMKVGGWMHYLHFYYNHRWARDNYLYANGGVIDSARRLATMFDYLWSDFKSGDLNSFPKLTSYGGWPHTYWDIVTIKNKRHTVMAPLYKYATSSQAQTYPCRYGLYWGSWRLRGYGTQSSCPSKSTSDYYRLHCEGKRWWKLYCKAY